MIHDELRALLAVYALDALDPEDERAVVAHLATCPDCQQELAALREVAASLATGVPMVQPPASLKAHIMEAIEPHGQAEPETRSQWPRRVVPLPERGSRNWTLAAAALAAVLAVVMVGVNVSLNRQLSTLNDRLGTQEQVLALLASPSAKTTALVGSVQANVRFVYDPVRKQGALVVSDLRDPGSEFVYQLWLVAGETPESAGVFRPVPGRPIIVPVQADFARYQAVAISLERGPSGAPKPSAAPILLATL